MWLLKWTGKAIQNHGFVLMFQVTVILAAEFLFYTHTLFSSLCPSCVMTEATLNIYIERDIIPLERKS